MNTASLQVCDECGYPWLTQDVLGGKLVWNEQGLCSKVCNSHAFVWLCLPLLPRHIQLQFYSLPEKEKKKIKRKKEKKKLSTEAPAYAKCCCQDFNSHEADADSECHSRLDGVTLGSPVKEKNQTDFKTATALCHVGLCLLELCPLVSSEAGLAVIPNTLKTDL